MFPIYSPSPLLELSVSNLDSEDTDIISYFPGNIYNYLNSNIDNRITLLFLEWYNWAKDKGYYDEFWGSLKIVSPNGVRVNSAIFSPVKYSLYNIKQALIYLGDLKYNCCVDLLVNIGNLILECNNYPEVLVYEIRFLYKGINKDDSLDFQTNIMYSYRFKGDKFYHNPFGLIHDFSNTLA